MSSNLPPSSKYLLPLSGNLSLILLSKKYLVNNPLIGFCIPLIIPNKSKMISSVDFGSFSITRAPAEIIKYNLGIKYLACWTLSYKSFTLRPRLISSLKKSSTSNISSKIVVNKW